MRHYKFRAWSNKYKMFHHKVLIGNTNPDADNYTCPAIWKAGEWLNAPSDEKDMSVEISQWTNFTEDNGMDVYDGDHVTFENVTRVVYYNEFMGMWEARLTDVTIEGHPHILTLSYCISTGYTVSGHKWI